MRVSAIQRAQRLLGPCDWIEQRGVIRPPCDKALAVQTLSRNTPSLLLLRQRGALRFLVISGKTKFGTRI